MARTYPKIIVHTLTGEFRSATSIVEQPWQDPGPGQVLIRNRFAGCNAIFDTNLCRNKIRHVNVVPPFDMGIESVGDVVAVGQGVTDFVPGDAVATTKIGTAYREYQLAEVDRLFKVRAATPEVLTLIPTGVSALVALERVANLRYGETVAVSAAAGGLGHIVVQLAKLQGCHVIALTSSPSKFALLQQLGADRIVDYRREDLAHVLQGEYPRGIDVAYDSVGGEIFDTFLDNLAMHGRLIISGHTSDFDKPVEDVPHPRIYRKLYWKSASVRAFQNPHFREFMPDAGRRILEMYYAGRLQVCVDPQPFRGLKSVPDAVDYVLGGSNVGKVVVEI